MLPLKPDQSQPLSKDQSILLLQLMMIEAQKPELIPSLLAGIKDEFLFKVYQKRREVLKLPLKITNTALFALICLCDRVGHVPLFMIDCMEFQRSRSPDDIEKAPEITLADVMSQMYPWGFYTEIAMIDRIDNEIKQGKGEFDFIY